MVLKFDTRKLNIRLHARFKKDARFFVALLFNGGEYVVERQVFGFQIGNGVAQRIPGPAGGLVELCRQSDHVDKAAVFVIVRDGFGVGVSFVQLGEQDSGFLGIGFSKLLNNGVADNVVSLGTGRCGRAFRLECQIGRVGSAEVVVEHIVGHADAMVFREPFNRVVVDVD